jgi:hypothetical protein
VDELKDFDTGIIGSFDEGGFLLAVEIRRDGNDCRIDRLSSIVGS